ncbi:MAG: ArsR family transcriptional regulator [Lachnospiraceae bacterium]|nr:ArsR family transcriptional regulator [Lachnospiraceae bacterium]
MKHYKSLREAELVFKALSAPMRVRIMELLYEDGDLKMDDIARKLKLTNSAISMHMDKLLEAGLIDILTVPGKRGNSKICKPRFDHMLIDMRPEAENIDFYEDDIPVGAYHDCKVSPTCGIATPSGIIGEFDAPKYFMFPNHYDAGVFWFGDGFVTYHLPNRLKAGERLTKLELSFEISSEYPGYNEDYPSDIYFEIAGVNVGKWISPGDYGARRGHFTPEWWPVNCNQYGLLKSLSITEEGTFIDGGNKISDVTIDELGIDYTSVLTFRISVPKDTVNCGGMTLFGKGFGDYDQGILCREYYAL